MDSHQKDIPSRTGKAGTGPHHNAKGLLEPWIGTSGWQYPDFSERFYPVDLDQRHQLGYYAEHFPTVEVNNTFYQLPQQDTIETWVRLVPKGFVFSVKASRFITHMKNLLEPEITLPPFYNRMSRFGDHCGPVLFQLPPHWRIDLERLKRFLPQLSSDFRHTIEFRNRTWLIDEVYELLQQYKVAFCIYDFNFFQSPMLTTADFAYIRLHGPGRPYHDPYDLEHLRRWAVRIREWRYEGLEVFCYFDNTHRGYAWENAQTLLTSLTEQPNSVE